MATGQGRGPSIAQDLLMLGDIYLTLARMAFQRMRYGSTGTPEAHRGASEASAVTMLRPHGADEEGPDTATQHRG
ncbi:MAG: hypothetical protein Q8Q00_05170 [Dehalococcoidia bacterium]|nr:hypothetical protein [Dehalococcoidia bacterium]